MTHNIGLGDRVAYFAKGLDRCEVKHFGCVMGIFLSGEIQIRSDEGLLHTVRAASADLIRPVEELKNKSSIEGD